MTTVQPGRYRHYKGNEYTVLGVAQHSETLTPLHALVEQPNRETPLTREELVVYRQEYGDHGLWVRPKQMFSETVTVDGQAVPRFRYVGG